MFPLIVCDTAYWLWVRISCVTDFPWAFATPNQQPLLRKGELAPSFTGPPQGCPESQRAPPLPPSPSPKARPLEGPAAAGKSESEWARQMAQERKRHILEVYCSSDTKLPLHSLHIRNRRNYFSGVRRIHLSSKPCTFHFYPLNELRNLATKNYSHLTACIQPPFRSGQQGIIPQLTSITLPTLL